MARKKVDAATDAPPPVSAVSNVTKKPRKKASTASVTAPEAKAKATVTRRKAVVKKASEETAQPVVSESVANLAAVVLDPREVEERAYLSWVERGCPMGSPDEDWFRAEQTLLARAAVASK